MIKEQSVSINGHDTCIKLLGFICDAPARSFPKGTVSHNAFYACERCKVKGEYHNNLCFLDMNAPVRSNTDFVLFQSEISEEFNETVSSHIKCCSPLLGVVDLVTDFPLDCMHLIYLGVMRRLLKFWTSRIPHKLPRYIISAIDDGLAVLESEAPTEFSRKPRSLKFIDRFKATEFRTFLLYTGPLVCKGKLPRKQYEHFLLLHSAVKGLVMHDQVSSSKLEEISECFYAFIKYGIELYGKSFVTYNVHNVIHVCDDYVRHGSLDGYSAFPFESFLGSLKRFIRTNHKPLQQVRNRIEENIPIFKRSLKKAVSLSHYDSAVSAHKQLSTSGLYLNETPRNCWFYGLDKATYMFKFAKQIGNEVFIYCHKVLAVKEFYSYPIPSTNNGIFIITKTSDKLSEVRLSQVGGKCALFTINEQKICCKLHSIDPNGKID